MNTREFFEQWHNDRKVELRGTTFDSETIYINRHIIPYFEKKSPNLIDITPRIIDLYCKEKLANGRADGKGGLSPVTVKKHLSVIRQALTTAVIYEYIKINPAREITVKKRATRASKDKYTFLTHEGAQNVLNALKGHYSHPIVAITLYYGLRKQEVLGLKWNAVDFVNMTLSIKHTVTKASQIYCADTTKTENSRRDFELLPDIAELLRDIKRKDNSGCEYIFHRDNGDPMRPDTLTKGFNRALVRNGLQKMRFHDLRHSTASILFDKGWELVDVQEWLGHTDIETTRNIYVHYTESRRKLSTNKIKGLFDISS